MGQHCCCLQLMASSQPLDASVDEKQVAMVWPVLLNSVGSNQPLDCTLLSRAGEQV